MKKFYSLLMIIPFIGFAQNLLTNPSFEEWNEKGYPEGWRVYKDSKKENATHFKAEENHEGTFSLGTKEKYSVLQNVEAKAGKKYKFSFWYKIPVGVAKSARIWVSWRGSDKKQIKDPATDDLLHPSEYFSTNTEWIHHEVEAVAPAGTVALDFGFKSYDGTEVYLDDMSLECLDCENLATSDLAPRKELKVAVNGSNLLVQGVNVKSVEVYNLAGQKVANSTFVGNLAKGVYIAVIQDVNGNKSSVKFVK